MGYRSRETGQSSWIFGNSFFVVFVFGLFMDRDEVLFCQTTRLIHHNQLLSTKFRQIFVILNRWRQTCSLLQIIEPMTPK